MKAVIKKIVRWRNPNFCIHPAINKVALLSFIWLNTISLIRGMKCLLYGKNPKMALFERGVKLFNTPKISFGKYLKLGQFVTISALGQEGVVLGDNVGIGAFSQVVVATSLSNPGAYIKLGNHVGIGEFAYLGGGGGLEIGNDCIIGQYFSCHPENHIATCLSLPIRQQGVRRKGIKIGDNCWIGSKVTILDGVEIGAGCIIAAGAVVNKSFPEHSIIGGVPAKILKSR